MARVSDKLKIKSEKLRTQKITGKPVAKSNPSPKSPLLLVQGYVSKARNFRPDKRTYIAIAILGLLLLAFYKKSWFVAATVNSTPITSVELLNRMNQQYREQTLNQLINERLLAQEASKKGVIVKSNEVDRKIAELEKNVGGAQSLDSLLTQQGQTRDSLKQQIHLQLTIQKLYENEATVSASEVQKYIEDNKSQLQATDSAGQTKEAEDALKQQKLSQIFNEKFSQIRQASKIQIF